MKTFLRLFLSALVLVAPTWANAGGYYRSSCYPSYSYPVVEKVVKEVLQPIYQLQYQFVPLYSVRYEAPVYSSTFTSSYQTVAQQAYATATPVVPYVQPVVHQTCEEKVSLLKQQMELMTARLNLLQPVQTQTNQQPTNGYQQPTNVPPAALPQQAPAETLTNGFHGILTAKCASCHEANSAAAKGGNFVMFQGQTLVSKDATAKARIAASLALGEMPKGGAKLSDAEFSEVMRWVKAQANGNGQ